MQRTEIIGFVKDDGTVLTPGDLVVIRGWTQVVWEIKRFEADYPHVDVILWLVSGEAGPRIEALYEKDGYLRTGVNWIRKLSPLELLALESS
jgi:hypothetical protein